MIESEFDRHPFVVNLNQLKTKLTTLPDEWKEDANAKQVQKRLDFLFWIFDTSSKSLISSNELDNLQSQINNILGHIENRSHFPSIDTWTSQIFAIFPYPRVQKIFRSEINEIVDEFSKNVDELVSKTALITDEVQNTEKKVEEESLRFGESYSKVSNDLKNIEEQIALKLSDFEIQMNTVIAEKLTEFSERFTRAQSERGEAFQNLRDSISKTITSIDEQKHQIEGATKLQIENSKKTLSEKLDQIEEEAGSIVDNLTGLYDAAGQTALAADFAGNAEKEKGQFEWLSKLAAGSFLLAASILGYLWFSLANEESFQFRQLFMRLPVSLVFLLPGFYFASIATSHRKSWIKLRSLGLRIKSFDAYLTPAEDTEKSKLRAEMVAEFFAEKTEESSRKGLFERSSEKHVDKALDIAESVVNKATPD